MADSTNIRKTEAVLEFFLFGATVLQWVRASLFAGFLDHAQRRTTAGRTPLDE